MVVNSATNSFNYQESNIQREKELNEVNKVLDNRAPIESNLVTNSNELPRTETVNEVDISQQAEKLNKKQEVSQEVVKERVEIQQGQQSAESSLGQNIDITV
jgi:hypothetical protein